jgi:hypothetical protein
VAKKVMCVHLEKHQRVILQRACARYGWASMAEAVRRFIDEHSDLAIDTSTVPTVSDANETVAA